MPSADLVAVQGYLRAAAGDEGGRVVRCGPFARRVSAASASPGLNYAIPDDGAVPTAVEVEALRAAFAGDDLEAAVEYLPACAPGAAAPLAAGGFAAVDRLPLMVLRAAVDVPPPGRVAIVLADTGTSAVTLGRVLAVRDAAFGTAGLAIEPGDVMRLGAVVRGGVLAFAHDRGEIVGSGVALPLRGGVTEIAAVGVVAGEQHRGIGAALVAAVAREAVARGARLIFLTAAGSAAGRVYTRAGFRPAGELVHLRAP